MKRLTKGVVAVLAATLAVGLIAGCSSQSAASGSASASTAASASAASGQNQEALVKELTDALASVPAFSSVTVNEEVTSVYSADDDSVESTSTFKFDISSDPLRTSATMDVEGTITQFFTAGGDAVYVADGSAYSGTVEQFAIPFANGFDAYIASTIGDLNVLIDCASAVEKDVVNASTVYRLTLDPEKYIATDEALGILADTGSPVQEAYVTIGFDDNGRIASIDQAVNYGTSTISKTLSIADYDSTSVEPIPEATKTFEDLQAEIEASVRTMVIE